MDHNSTVRGKVTARKSQNPYSPTGYYWIYTYSIYVDGELVIGDSTRGGLRMIRECHNIALAMKHLLIAGQTFETWDSIMERA